MKALLVLYKDNEVIANEQIEWTGTDETKEIKSLLRSNPWTKGALLLEKTAIKFFKGNFILAREYDVAVYNHRLEEVDRIQLETTVCDEQSLTDFIEAAVKDNYGEGASYIIKKVTVKTEEAA